MTAGRALLRDGVERSLKIFRSRDVRRDNREAERRPGAADVHGLAHARWISGIRQKSRARQAGYEFFQDFKPLWNEVGVQVGYAGDVAAGPREIRHKTRSDRVSNLNHDRHHSGCVLRRQSCLVA